MGILRARTPYPKPEPRNTPVPAPAKEGEGSAWCEDAVGGSGMGGPCSEADMAEPYGVHDLADIQRFVQRFTVGSCRADLRAPWGVIDLADLQAFVGSFQDGCTN